MSQLQIHTTRDGAKIVKDTGRVLFNAAAASEYLNPFRSVSPMPPLKDLQLIPGVLYRVHTGLLIAGCTAMPVRPTPEIFAETGMAVLRVDEYKDELVVYVTVLAKINVHSKFPWFETFAMNQYEIEVTKGVQARSSVVTVDGPTVQSPPPRPQQAGGAPARELSDAEKTKLFDSALRGSAPAAEPVQTVQPGGPAVNHPVNIPNGATRLGMTPGAGG